MNRISFEDIPSNLISSTYNPLSIADQMVQSYNFQVKYVAVHDAKSTVPKAYTVYTITHISDTVQISTIGYDDGIIVTNARARGGSWIGWKKATMSAV